MTGAAAEAAALFDEALAAFNVYRGDPVGLLDRAMAAAPDFAMAHILEAYLMGLATEPEATRAAKAILMRVGTMRLNEREGSHAAALQLLVEGRWTDAAMALEKHSARWLRPLQSVR